MAWTFEAKDRQTRGFRALPIPHRIIADVQCLVRGNATHFQRTMVNQRIGFVRAEFAGEKDVRKELRDTELFQDHAQAAVEV